MGLVYNPIHNRKDNNDNEITNGTNRLCISNVRYNNFYAFRSSHFRNINYVWWCNVNVWGATR